MSIIKRRARLAALAVLPLAAFADVTLPALLSDHVVLRRGPPIHVWGKAAPSEAVSVAFRGDGRDAVGQGNPWGRAQAAPQLALAQSSYSGCE